MSGSEDGSSSHQGEVASPSEAVWKEELRERGVEVRSGDKAKSGGGGAIGGARVNLGGAMGKFVGKLGGVTSDIGERIG